MKSFTNQSVKDKPEGFTDEEYTIMYAAWGKFIEMSGSLIPWNKFLDYVEPVTIPIETNEDGTIIMETTIKLRFIVNPEEVLNG